jgi:tetratricopeptide (TPR) repeat protein
MYLSFFGEKMDQAAAGAALRPFKDDKNVSPEELAEYARRQGLNAISRVNGDELLLRRLVAAGVPVLIETWYEPKPNDGMGHYRLITGYDDSRREWIAYDSYDSSGIVRGAPYEGIRLSYSDFDRLWKVFNRTYLLLYDDAHRSAVEGIIGSDLEDDAMWQRALDAASIEAESSPADPFAHFNLGSAQVAVGNYSAAAESYDRARVLGLPWRMLWYQFGPFRAYYEIGRMDEVLALANATLRSTKSLEEAWFWRGLAHNALGDRVAARDAWSRALSLRPNYPDALAAMESLR